MRQASITAVFFLFTAVQSVAQETSIDVFDTSTEEEQGAVLSSALGRLYIYYNEKDADAAQCLVTLFEPQSAESQSLQSEGYTFLAYELDRDRSLSQIQRRPVERIIFDVFARVCTPGSE